MNRFMEIKLNETSDSDITEAIISLIENRVYAMIDGSDLAVELAVEVEDADNCTPAIWAHDDADTALEEMCPSDIIDAVLTGDCDDCKYWRRINPDTNQIESYDNGDEVIEKALEIIRDNIGDYLCSDYDRDTILTMAGLDIDDLCEELCIEDDLAEIESVELFSASGESMDIEETLCNKVTWERVVELMDDDYREIVHDELAPCSELEFLMEYLRYDHAMPYKIRNTFGYELEVDCA